jgi:hypothetical protein
VPERLLNIPLCRRRTRSGCAALGAHPVRWDPAKSDDRAGVNIRAGLSTHYDSKSGSFSHPMFCKRDRVPRKAEGRHGTSSAIWDQMRTRWGFQVGRFDLSYWHGVVFSASPSEPQSDGASKPGACTAFTMSGRRERFELSVWIATAFAVNEPHQSAVSTACIIRSACKAENASTPNRGSIRTLFRRPHRHIGTLACRVSTRR